MAITSFVFATSITTWKTNYPTKNSAWIKVENKPNNNEDWVGIYAEGSNNDWENVIQWKWAKNTSEATDPGDWYKFTHLKDGNYEARFFLKNTFVSEDAIKFSIGKSVNIKTSKENYELKDEISVTVNGTLSGDKDWVGIYHKGDSSAWANVYAWNWVKAGKTVLNKINKQMIETGEYEIRLFFHNATSDKKIEAKQSFQILNKVSISTKNHYDIREDITVTIKNQAKDNKNWIGIYPKGASNSWGNVLVWNWSKGKNSVRLDGIDKGDYEARLFYKDSFKLEAKVEFTVGDNANNYVYGSKGPYINDVQLLENPDYFAYYPKHNINGAPLVLLSGYSGLQGYKGLMQYLASQGCYVIAHANRKNNEGWSDPVPRIKHFEKAILDVKKLGVDTSRLITMGSSAGGMVSYKIMEHFKKQGYGMTKSFIIDIEGYYVPNMTKSDLDKLESDSLILHLGGYTGVQDGAFDEDPRTLLTLSKLLNNNQKKSFIVLNQTSHHYAGGNYQDIIKKNDLLKPIDAMLKYEFFNDNGEYNNAKAILFDNYNQTIQKVYDLTMVKVGNKEPLNIGYDYPCVNPYNENGEPFNPEENGEGRPFSPTIDYCNDHGLQ